MQLYRFLRVVIILAVSARAVENGTCLVPLIPNGNIQGHFHFVWSSFRYIRQVMTVGSTASNNVTLTLVCHEGKSDNGTRMPETKRIMCLNGKWKPDPSCPKKTCSVPLITKGHMQEQRFTWRTFRWDSYRNVSVGSRSSDEATLLLVCDENHSLQGAGVSSEQRIKCSNGQWSPNPVCLKNIICPPIDEKDVFIVVYNNARKINSTARFYCKDVNQEIDKGNDIWNCLPPGNWSGGIPKCKVSQCAIEDLFASAPEFLLPNLESVSEEFVPAGVELPLMCEDNLILVGSPKVMCGRRGTWRYGNTKCLNGCHLDLKSLSPQLIIDTFKQYFHFGEYVDLSCPFGMKLSSEVEMLMCMGSRWSDEVPDCQ